MDITGLRMVFVGLLCLHAAEGQDVTQNVTGPEFVATDGTREMNLTCPGPTDSDIRYNWFTPEPNKTRCEKDATGKVCTFRPTREDDGKIVSCRVSNASGVLHRATYQVNLKYPPKSKPTIKKTGEYSVTCDVTGGKPPVSNVTLNCEALPKLGSKVQPSQMSISYLTTEANITCTCSAHWDPEPELYPGTVETVNLQFNRQYRALANELGVAAMVFLVMCVI